MTTATEFRDYFLSCERGWCIGEFENRAGERCALGHLIKNEQLMAVTSFRHYHFSDLFESFPYPNDSVSYVNDTKSEMFPQETPKERIIAALNKLIEMGH